MIALVLVAAIVTQDATPLRAAATEKAARQTLLYAGDWLELRGERQGWLQVYDHRHERPGYVRPSQVRTFPVDESSARELAAVIDFIRDQPGAESLGIGLVALYLRAAPAAAVGAEVFDALGGMAQRLARRGPAGPIEVAESYGVKFNSFERDAKARLCYDGEAWRRVMALPASAAAKARAALGLTEPACVDPALPAAERETLSAWQADVLGKLDVARLPPWLADRVRVRAAAVSAAVTYAQARRGDWKAARTAEEAAERALALVDKSELADDDVAAYDEAAVRVAAVRWAAESPSPKQAVEIATRNPGETCVRFAKLEHCTYAVVWPASVRVAPHGDAVVFAQSPLPSWTELVVVRRGHEPQTLAPAAIDPEVGYVELAGFSPDGAHLLVAREARMTGPLGAPNTLAPWIARTFQILRAADSTVEKQASRLDNFVSFRRWQSPDWRRTTLALR
ncbi:MAG TPA: hypothetical protein VF334_01710 [Polyangia bacterium]